MSKLPTTLPTTDLEGENPEILHIYNVASEVVPCDKEHQLNVALMFRYADGEEGGGIYPFVCVSAGGHMSEWYPDDAKIQAGQVPEEWSISTRDILKAMESGECTLDVFVAAEMLRKMEQRYTVDAEAVHVHCGIEITVTFSQKERIAHRFVVRIPEDDVCDWLDMGDDDEECDGND